MLETLILEIQYDGTNYFGWQKQLNQKSIQEKLEKALFKLFNEELIAIGSGRTDTGVHAAGQVVSIKFENGVKYDLDIVKKALNRYLPATIKIINIAKTNKDFNARFDAVSREYLYNLNIKSDVFKQNFSAHIRYNMDIGKLKECAEFFIGKNDFTSISKFNKDTKNYNCDVLLSEWTQIDEFNFQYKVRANRFVYGMVRSIVGIMIDYARNKKTKEDIEKAFALQDRNLKSPLAPANGLILNKIYYVNNLFE
ncbi:MAG: tRNA pseudouridine(38-40) synthase TruA [Candidatus Kapabacteria bacterium]|nr:tRNA pseudouridine(38-40) synthase TruA [Candidatus Kapabacteria bacterium]